MQDILQYLLKWSIALAVVYVFYRLVLRPLTFYQWNRRYLVLYSLVAFFIPFIDINTYVPPQQLQGFRLVKYIPAIHFSADASTTAAEAQSTPVDVLLIAGLLIATGSILLLTRLLLQWYSLRRIRRTAVPLYHPEANVYHVNEHVVPFSFGNSIYVNTTLHSQQELQDIILHEFVHVRQKHSFDIILSEVLCILNWYNPFAWCIRHAIRQNLEFIADQSVLNNGLDKKTYQYHLLKVIGSSQYSIANKFNFSSLKKRIAMMNRLKSARVHLVKFVFVLPLAAIMLVAFRNRNNEGWNNHKQLKNDTIPNHEFVLPNEMLSGITMDDWNVITLKEFYKRNSSVKEIAWSNEDELIVYLKNGKREAYNTNDEEDMQRFHKKYGNPPTIMPPAPPAAVWAPFPPIPPGEPIELEDLVVEVPDVVELAVPEMEIETPGILADPEVEIPGEVLEEQILQQKDDLDKFYKRNPQVQAIMWRKGEVIIKKKNGDVETYTMSDEEDMQRFEDKYGEMPAPPPVPPKPPVIIKVDEVKRVKTVTPAPPIPPAPAKLPEGVSSMEVSNNILTVELKDGTQETYDLNKPTDKEKAEKKYGKVIRPAKPREVVRYKVTQPV